MEEEATSSSSTAPTTVTPNPPVPPVEETSLDVPPPPPASSSSSTSPPPHPGVEVVGVEINHLNPSTPTPSSGGVVGGSGGGGGEIVAKSSAPPPNRDHTPHHIVYRKMERIIERMQEEGSGVPVRTVKSFLTKIPSVFTGTDLVTWILKHMEVEDQSEWFS